MTDIRNLTLAPPSTEPLSHVRRGILFLVAMWVLALGPFLLWRGTWFGRPLSEQQVGDYLHDRNPKHTLHAVSQLSERIQRHDSTVSSWYPDIVRLSGNANEQVRAAVATVMGTDPTSDEFHEALLEALHDSSPSVRVDAALALAHFGDASGRAEVLATLDPMRVYARTSGTVQGAVHAGASVKQLALLATISNDKNDKKASYQLLAPVAGRVQSVGIQNGQHVQTGALAFVLEPSPEQMIVALQALHAIGRQEDLAKLRALTQESLEIPEKVRVQALATVRAIEAKK